jgi:hypothetical protein
MLVSSENADVCNNINLNRKEPNFLKLINKIFKKPFLVFGITKLSFGKLKKKYVELRDQNELPQPYKIDNPKLENDNNNATQVGIDLFGEVFEK